MKVVDTEKNKTSNMRCSSYKFVKLIQPNFKTFLQHCDYIWGNSLFIPGNLGGLI